MGPSSYKVEDALGAAIVTFGTDKPRSVGGFELRAQG